MKPGDTVRITGCTDILTHTALCEPSEGPAGVRIGQIGTVIEGPAEPGDDWCKVSVPDTDGQGGALGWYLPFCDLEVVEAQPL